jgi:hypothetical protein
MIQIFRTIAEVIGWLVLAVFIIWPLDISFKNGIFRFCYFDSGLIIIDRRKNEVLVSRMKEIGYRLIDVRSFSVGISLPSWLGRLIYRHRNH